MQALRAQTARFVAIVFALGWLLAPVISALHSDDHAHRYCEQHQAFEELSAASGGNVSVAPSMELTADLSDAQHERCEFAAFTVRHALAVTRAQSVAAVSAWRTVSRVHEARGFAVTSVLDDAPKSSPPVRA